jgi:hypothetical protein
MGEYVSWININTSRGKSLFCWNVARQSYMDLMIWALTRTIFAELTKPQFTLTGTFFLPFSSKFNTTISNIKYQYHLFSCIRVYDPHKARIWLTVWAVQAMAIIVLLMFWSSCCAVVHHDNVVVRLWSTSFRFFNIYLVTIPFSQWPINKV